uniref:Uncharacterized protein n=1 Tax=Tanacetum cinerariifolium TaxID=118510 RepID=A0A699GQC8_TANCI|nr:hypothetical protein [Tanacetum cinerariifolium]
MSDDVLPNHRLAAPASARGKFHSIMLSPKIPGVLNKLAISKTFRKSSIASSVLFPKKVPNDTPSTPGIDGIPPLREDVIETYAIVSKEIRKNIDVETEAVQIILTRIDNDIYSTVDACLNAMEMWKAIERLKQGDSVNVQDLETDLYWEFRKFTSRIANSLPSTHDQELEVVADDEASLMEKEIDKLMALILMYFNKIYKPTNNNLRTSSNTENINIDNTPRFDKRTEFRHVVRECKKAKWVRDLAYHKEKMLLCKQEEAKIQFSAEQAIVVEPHYMYMAKIQEVIPDIADNSGPIF